MPGAGPLIYAARMRRDKGMQLLLVGATAVLALAASHFFLHWVLFSDALVRRLLHG